MSASNGSIVGTWYIGNPGGGTDQIAFTFLADGTFLVADKGTVANDPNGTSGLEWGNYTWDAASGALSLDTLINTDGQWGLSHSGGVTTGTATVIDDVLTFIDPEGSFAIPRLMSPPDSIVGSWYLAPNDPNGGTDQIVFTFLADGTFLIADKGTVARDPSGTSGIEWGNYTWDPVTGATVVNVVVNTDLQWGIASFAPETVEATVDVQGDVLAILVSDGDTGSLVRLSPLTAAASTITGTPNADSLTGTAAADTILGLASNDTLSGLGGNDSLDGGAGIDTASYSGTRAGYALSNTATGFTLADNAGSDGTDTLTGVERLHFADTNVALDLDGNAGNVARILGAVFGGAAVTNKAYVSIGLSFLDGGMSYESLMALAIDYRLGGVSHTAIVNLLYTNLIGTTPSPSQLDAYVALLAGGTYTVGGLGVLAASTPFNETNIGLAGLAQTGIEFN